MMDRPTATLVRGRGIIDGTGTGLREGDALLVEGHRIVAVGRTDELAARADTTIDLADLVIVPGFVDVHSHITVRPGEGDQHGQLQRPAVWQALRGVGNLISDIASGVTTMRVMGENHRIDVEFKDAIARGDLKGPRLLIATRALSSSHGHGSSFGTVDGPDDLRKAVRENVKAGADHIKIFATGGVSSRNTPVDVSSYSREEIRAVVEEAERCGRKVAAHAHGGEGVDLCAEEGVHSIEHGALLTEDNVKRMGVNRTWLVLTNTILFRPEGVEKGDANEPSVMQKLLVARERAEESFYLARSEGLPLALGTDAMHGFFGHEMEWLVRHGVSEEQAIIAGTGRGAEVMGLADEVGTLEPGKCADFVALKGNPLEDIRFVHDVVSVFKDGRDALSDSQGPPEVVRVQKSKKGASS